jgi:hypothetical protein
MPLLMRFLSSDPQFESKNDRNVTLPLLMSSKTRLSFIVGVGVGDLVGGVIRYCGVNLFRLAMDRPHVKLEITTIHHQGIEQMIKKKRKME